VNPLIKQRLYFTLFRLTGLVSLGILVIVLLYLIQLGSGVISFRFLTQMWVNSDITEGGIYPAIVGTFYLGVGVAVFSIPVGVACAVYLNEYAGHSFLVRMIRLAIRNLAGVPSIIYGLFGFAVFVQMLNFGTSITAASLTLSGMTIPWVITASEESPVMPGGRICPGCQQMAGRTHECAALCRIGHDYRFYYRTGTGHG
jgi:phosphate transport system permease protein